MTETESNGDGSRLADRFRALSTRGAADLDRWLLIAGGVALPLGIVLILLGWAGSSRTPFVFEQIPYLISGGLLGMALVFAGGFVYFTYWQTRSVRETREHQREVLAALDHIASLLGSEVPASSSRLVSTAKGAMFHREDCPVAQRAKDLRTVRGTERGLRPCGICNPVPA
jgi:hypothetical protein